LSTAGGFVAVTEREGNNEQVIQALDVNGDVVGTTITINISDYVDLGVSVAPGGGGNSNMVLYPIDNLAPVGTEIYGLRVSFGTSSNANGDGPDAKAFFFGNTNLLTCDFDGDGIPNYLDLDSDNDGIFDVDEAGHAAADANDDGVIDGAPSSFGVNGLFDAVETSADNGIINYGIADSEPSPDGIFDSYELDSDGDGCLDAAEESVSDTDANGIAGAGTTTVNGDGLVIGNTYASPANNMWQNPAASNCPTLSGRIFEDVNYGGGAGRTYATANSSAQSSGWSNGAIAVANVRVELYSSTGAFVTTENTAANGSFSFANLTPGTYQVRYVTQSITSNRGSNSTGDTPYAVPTFRGVSSTTYTTEIGGVDPTKEDAPANTTNLNLSALSTGSTVVQAVSTVSGASGDVTNIDLGVSFNVVTNTNDAGIGSLHQFILNSNELNNTNLDLEDDPAGRPFLAKPAGVDVSIFEIPGSGSHTIALSGVLPDVEDEFTHISGYTQQGSVQGLPEARTITIGLDGSSGGYDGLILRSNNTTVSGLALHDFNRGIEMVRSGVANCHIWGNYVGLQTDGMTIGTNTGTGIYAQNQSSVVIGTNGDGTNDNNEGNVVCNSYEGINLRASSNSLVAGNYIGVDRTGMTDAGNRYHGIHLRGCTIKNVVGLDDNISTLTATAGRNVSSGNGTDGVRLSSSSNQVVAGNFLGTDRTGTSGVRNAGYGLQFVTTASNNQIGTDSDNSRDVEERNVISGNQAGLRFVSGSTGADNWIAGNYIGVDVTGNVALPNLNNGVELTGSQTGTIVGTNGDGVRDAIERNVISGNEEDGIRIGGAQRHIVAGNRIGVGADPTISVPNEGRGIIVSTTANNNIIGYSPTMANSNPAEVGNIIRGNGDCGVALAGTGVNNRLSRNDYGNHTNLAIDIDYDLVTLNDDGDGDSGPNNWLNYPVLSYSKVSATILRIKGFAPAGATVEFYIADAGPTPGPTLPTGFTSSFGEGFTYLGEAVEGSADDDDATTGTYTDDGSGSSTVKTEQKFSFDLPIASLNAAISVGDKLTAISIDATGNTSEFGGVMQARFIEICNDLIDNDGDGEIDCEDDDCPNVNTVVTVSN
ncbi:MAG: SdrD B-like domain-containing protein, partial [Saprospiraceae bacterium]